MEETVFTVDVSKAARLQRALKWASGTKQVSHCMLSGVHEPVSTYWPRLTRTLLTLTDWAGSQG